MDKYAWTVIFKSEELGREVAEFLPEVRDKPRADGTAKFVEQLRPALLKCLEGKPKFAHLECGVEVSQGTKEKKGWGYPQTGRQLKKGERKGQIWIQFKCLRCHDCRLRLYSNGNIEWNQIDHQKTRAEAQQAETSTEKAVAETTDDVPQNRVQTTTGVEEGAKVSPAKQMDSPLVETDGGGTSDCKSLPSSALPEELPGPIEEIGGDRESPTAQPHDTQHVVYSKVVKNLQPDDGEEEEESTALSLQSPNDGTEGSSGRPKKMATSTGGEKRSLEGVAGYSKESNGVGATRRDRNFSPSPDMQVSLPDDGSPATQLQTECLRKKRKFNDDLSKCFDDDNLPAADDDNDNNDSNNEPLPQDDPNHNGGGDGGAGAGATFGEERDEEEQGPGANNEEQQDVLEADGNPLVATNTRHPGHQMPGQQQGDGGSSICISLFVAQGLDRMHHHNKLNLGFFTKVTNELLGGKHPIDGKTALLLMKINKDLEGDKSAVEPLTSLQMPCVRALVDHPLDAEMLSTIPQSVLAHITVNRGLNGYGYNSSRNTNRREPVLELATQKLCDMQIEEKLTLKYFNESMDSVLRSGIAIDSGIALRLMGINKNLEGDKPASEPLTPFQELCAKALVDERLNTKKLEGIPRSVVAHIAIHRARGVD